MAFNVLRTEPCISLIAASIFAAEMLYVSGSTSTKTGMAPTRLTAPAVAKKVYGVVITRSPCPIFAAIKDNNSASVPEDTPTAYFVEQ